MAQRRLVIGLLLGLLSGCAHHPRAQNPLPGVFRVAVVPFGDKTNGAEGVDPERITELFASELQKIPTYEVVPVQEVKEVLGGQRVETNQPALAYALARSVHAQAIIVGDVTEYDAYYPPRLGLHCEMYAMVTGQPALAVELTKPESEVPPGTFLGIPFGAAWERLKHLRHRCSKDCPPNCRECQKKKAKSNSKEADPAKADKEKTQVARSASAAGTNPTTDPELQQVSHETSAQGALVRSPQAGPIVEPWAIRHSRIFDSANLGFARKLEDYYFFRRDQRGGESTGYLERTEDFHRFSCNRMIYEMLEAAGGEWTPLVGVEFPMPWEPWPWR